MKKSLRNAISLSVVMAIALTCSFGCKPAPKASSSPKPAVSAKSTDLQGRTIRILDYRLQPGKGTAPYDNMGYTGQKEADRVTAIQNKFNCSIEHVGTGDHTVDWGNLRTSIAKGDPIADICYVAPEMVVQSIEHAGDYAILNDYKDILDLSNPDLWDQNVTQGLYTIKGLTAGLLPATRGAELVNTGAVMFFNKTILQKSGVWSENNFYDLQNNKQWTWDKFNSIAKQLVADTNGDGKIDRFALTYNSQTCQALNASNSNGGNAAGFFAVTGDQAVFQGRNKPQLEVMNFLLSAGQKNNKWLTCTEYSGGTNYISGPQKEFVSGKAVCILDQGSELQTYKTMKMVDTIGAVACPIGPSNTDGEYHLGRGWFQAWVIPSGLDKTDQIAMVMKDFCAPLYNKEESDAQTEAMLADYVGDEQGVIDTYKLLGDPTLTTNIWENPFLGTGSGPMFSFYGNLQQIAEGKTTPDALLKKWADTVQLDANGYWQRVLEGADSILSDRASATTAPAASN